MTRRLLTLKWLFYSLWTLLFLLVQQLVLPHLRIWGVHPFLLPALAAIAASFEGKREGPVFAIILGLVCDALFTGAFPGFYTAALLLSAVSMSMALWEAVTTCEAVSLPSSMARSTSSVVMHLVMLAG